MATKKLAISHTFRRMYVIISILRGIYCIYLSIFPYDNLENLKGLLKLAKTRKNSQNSQNSQMDIEIIEVYCTFIVITS